RAAQGIQDLQALLRHQGDVIRLDGADAAQIGHRALSVKLVPNHELQIAVLVGHDLLNHVLWITADLTFYQALLPEDVLVIEIEAIDHGADLENGQVAFDLEKAELRVGMIGVVGLTLLEKVLKIMEVRLDIAQRLLPAEVVRVQVEKPQLGIAAIAWIK